jgi:hypothetical protein
MFSSPHPLKGCFLYHPEDIEAKEIRWNVLWKLCSMPAIVFTRIIINELNQINI